MAMQADDAVVSHLVHSLRKCVDMAVNSAPSVIKLKRFVAQSYIGLFLEDEAASWFRELAQNCATSAKRHGEFDDVVLIIGVC